MSDDKRLNTNLEIHGDTTVVGTNEKFADFSVEFNYWGVTVPAFTEMQAACVDGFAGAMSKLLELGGHKVKK